MPLLLIEGVFTFNLNPKTQAYLLKLTKILKTMFSITLSIYSAVIVNMSRVIWL